MNFKSVSSIPIVDLSEVSSQLTRDEMNNVRFLRQKEKETYEKKFLERSREVKEPIISEIKSEGKELIINKLRLLLSQKYNLSLNDYIILIDKFKLDSTQIDRGNIIDLISYLNTQSNYSKNSMESLSKKEEIIDTEVINSLDLEKRFEIMERERNEMIRNIIGNDSKSLNNKEINTTSDIVINNNPISDKNIENTIPKLFSVPIFTVE